VGLDSFGQSCSCTLSNFKWTVGGTTFQSWSPTTPAFPNATPPTAANPSASYYDPGPGPLTNPTAHWYWNDPNQATETVSCTATVTPPTGQGAAFPVTATRKVSVQLPAWTATGTGGYMQVNTANPDVTGTIALYAGPSAGQQSGMNWSANVFSSALFTSGTLVLVQTATPSRSYITYTGVGVPGVTHTDPENGKLGLDTRYPYHWNTYGSYSPPALPVPYTTYDDPWQVLNGIASIVLQDQFSDYLMFMPPGSDSQLVPLATFAWGTNGSATIPTTGNWADYVKQNGSDKAGTVSPASQPFTASNGFPSWAQIDVYPSF